MTKPPFGSGRDAAAPCAHAHRLAGTAQSRGGGAADAAAAAANSSATACAIAAAACCLFGLLAPAWSVDALTPGADLSDCRSALHPGPTVCFGIDAPLANVVPVQTAGNIGARQLAGLEDRIDAFLASYGKPPREAVRALLDPSEENIRAYLRKHEETLATAAYVAARMTALQQAGQPKAAGISPGLPPDPASFRQIRAWLVTAPRDADARDALLALRALARQQPLLEAGVQLVGSLSPAQLREEISRIDPVLSVAVVVPGSVDPDLIPYVRIEDLRSRRAVAVTARSLTADRLAHDIAALRQSPVLSQASAAEPLDSETTP